MAQAVVRHVDDVAPVPCPCGMATRVITARDGSPASYHVTQIHHAELHFHQKTTEIYHILEGTGRIELDGVWHEIRPGSMVLIPAGIQHRIHSDAGLTTAVVAIPAFDPTDEFVVS